jgi:hypothetical protein
MNPKTLLAKRLLGGASLLFVAAASAQASDQDGATFDVGIGLDAASGNYGGTVRVDERSVALVMRYKRNGLTYKASVPYLRVVGPIDVVRIDGGAVICDDSRGGRRGRGRGGSGSGSGSDDSSSDRGSLDDCASSPATTTATERVGRSGLGDVQLELGWELPEWRAGGPSVELISKIKLGTASTRKGLGTGKNTYSVQADVAQAFGDNALLAGVGFRVYEKIAGINVKNTPFFSFGGKRQFGESSSLKVVIERRQPVEVGTTHAAELIATFEGQWRAAWRMEAYVFKGLTSASADVGAGLVLARSF